MKKNGISLIALIITIIVMIILATIVINTSITTPKSANFAKFATDISELQEVMTMNYLDLFAQEEVKSNGMTKEEIYKYIANGNEYTGEYLPSIKGATTAWKLSDASRLNGIEGIPNEYGDLYVTDNGVVFLSNAYEFGEDKYITASLTYETGGGDSTITNEQLLALKNEILRSD